MKPSDRERKQFEQVKNIPRDPARKAESWRKIQEEVDAGARADTDQPPFFKRYWQGVLVPAAVLLVFVIISPFVGNDTDEGADAPPAQEEVVPGSDGLPETEPDDSVPETRGVPGEEPADAVPFEAAQEVTAERLMDWAGSPELVDVDLVIDDTALFLTALGGVPDDDQDRVITAVLAALEDEGRTDEALSQIRESTDPAAEAFIENSEEAEQ